MCFTHQSTAKFKAIEEGTAKALKAQDNMPPTSRSAEVLSDPHIPNLGPTGDYQSNFLLHACPFLVSRVQLWSEKGTRKSWVQTEKRKKRGTEQDNTSHVMCIAFAPHISKICFYKY